MNPAQSAAMLQALDYAPGLVMGKKSRPVAVPTFRGAAAEAQKITAPEWIVGGPYDTGKTYGCTNRLDTEARATKNGLFAIVRRVRADYNSSVRRRWEATIKVRGGVEIRGGTSPTSYFYRESGSEVLVLGLDRDSSILSGEFDGMYVNQAEELPVSSWENLSTRVTGRGATTRTPMLWGDCNPSYRQHWIQTRKRLVLLNSTHKDNPDLYDGNGVETSKGASRLGPLRAMTGVRFKRYYLGEWVTAEGAVYPFDSSIHVISRAQLPQIRRWVCSVDFGYVAPFVWQRWGLDGDGNMYLEREIYRTKRTVRVHAEEINRLDRGLLIDATVCDHDTEDRATLEENGIPTVAAYKAVRRGVENVETRTKLIAQPAFGDPNTIVQRPRLYVLDDACEERDEELASAKKPLCTLDEFPNYRYKVTPDGKPVKEEPVKEDDHGMDAMRYAAAYIDNLHIEGSGDFRAEAGDPAVFASDYDLEEHGPGDPMEEGGREF